MKRMQARLACAVFAVFLFTGCEQIFTFSPLSFLQRPVSDLTPEQQLNYGRDALANGDPEEMLAAYEALSADTTSGEAQYLASQLAVELSGVPDLVTGVLDGSVTLPDEFTTTTIDQFIADNGLDPAYLMAAADNLENAQTLGTPLEPMDYAMGALGLALQAAEQPDGTFDFTNADLASAEQFVTEGVSEVADLPTTDPTYQLLTELQSIIGTL